MLRGGKSIQAVVKEADTIENGAELSDGVGETGYIDCYGEPIVFGGGLSDGSNLGIKY